MSAAEILAAIERADAAVDRVRVEVPEWGCALWFRRQMTVLRRQQITAGLPKDDEARLIASYILHEAEDEAGAKVFKVDAVSRAAMEGKADLRVLQRIMQEIGEAETPAAAKNG